MDFTTLLHGPGLCIGFFDFAKKRFCRGSVRVLSEWGGIRLSPPQNDDSRQGCVLDAGVAADMRAVAATLRAMAAATCAIAAAMCAVAATMRAMAATTRAVAATMRPMTATMWAIVATMRAMAAISAPSLLLCAP